MIHTTDLQLKSHKDIMSIYKTHFPQRQISKRQISNCISVSKVYFILVDPNDREKSF